MNRKLRGALLGPSLWALALGACLAVALADVWDPEDNDHFTTTNELVHGTIQHHEIGPGALGRDTDFFRIGQRPFSSYEVLVDSASSEAGSLMIERYQNGVLTQSGVSTHLGPSRSLRWQNSLNSTVPFTAIRVWGAADCNGCSSARSTYAIRAFETTYSIPRFNNSGSQSTIVIIHNTAAYEVAVTLHFLAVDGTPLGSHEVVLQKKQLLVSNTTTLPFAQNTTGSILITHNGRYGDLSGKAVALEPSTGYTFDTPMTPRPL